MIARENNTARKKPKGRNNVARNHKENNLPRTIRESQKRGGGVVLQGIAKERTAREISLQGDCKKKLKLQGIIIEIMSQGDRKCKIT